MGALLLHLLPPLPVVSGTVAVAVDGGAPLTGWGRLPDTEEVVASSNLHVSLALWVDVSAPHDPSGHLCLLVPRSVTLLRY